MTRIIICVSIICTALVRTTIPVHSQVVSDSVLVADSSQRLRNEIDSLKTLINVIFEENRKVQQELQKAKPRMEEYRRLKEREARLRDSVQVQTSEIELVRVRIDSVDSIIQGLEDRTRKVERNLNGLGREYIKRNESLIYASFREMDIETIDRVIDGCESYGSDEDVAKFRHRAQLISEGKRRYDRSWQALNEPCDTSLVNALIVGWRQDCREYDISQRQEVDELVSHLEVFDKGVKVFEQFVGTLNGELRLAGLLTGSSQYEDFYYMVRREMAEDIESYVMSIPFLEEKFRQYKEQRYVSEVTEAEKGLRK